jgi:peptidoglycan/xylan/chitin deacetylase (PgdA/CDA1 family)
LSIDQQPPVFGRRQFVLGGGTFVAGMAAVIAWTETHAASGHASVVPAAAPNDSLSPLLPLQPSIPAPPSTVNASQSSTPVSQPSSTPTTTIAAPVSNGGPAKYISHGPADVQNVALTFHFGGDPKLVSTLLDELKNQGIISTFFAIGDWITAHPDLTKRAIADGHELGNHTKSHKGMLKLSREQVRSEIVGGGTALEPFIGSIGKWFRPSGTDVPNDIILEEAGKAGYSVSVGYDIDSRDFKEPGAQAVITKVNNELHAGAIVSLHFGHQDTIDALPKIAALVTAAGLTPVTVTGLLG